MFSMKLSWLIGSAFCLTVLVAPEQVAAMGPSAQSQDGPSAPPRVCEIRQKAWCMYQESSEITDQQVTDSQDSEVHIWAMRNNYYPNSVLMIVEPNGCRNAFANEVKSLEYDKSIKWHGKIWDQMLVRLRTDGSCDLKLLVPVYDHSPLEWAFSVGRLLIAACPDEQCSSIVPTPADVTDKYRKQFMLGDKSNAIN